MAGRARYERLDAADPLARLRDQFDLPAGIYLDGNSLGALPRTVGPAMARCVEREWGRDLVSGWTRHDWIGLARRAGDRIGRLIGAAPGQVMAGDSISVNLFKLLSAALASRPGRTVILSTRDNFPTDLYIAQGLARQLGPDCCELRLVEPVDVQAALNDEVAVLMLTQVDFRSGRLYDMEGLTTAAHDAGALALWDLAHSAGVLPLELDRCQVDLAVGCGYKYLNGGPGAPAFLYVAERHHEAMQQPLSGWMGHRSPFEFPLEYEPAPGIGRFAAGTPPILSLRALDAALDIWDGVDMGAVRAKSKALTDAFIECVERYDEAAELTLASPRDASLRGSQVSWRHPEGYAIIQALAARGVTGDFRDPDLMRFGFAPLYNRYTDAWDAAEELADTIKSGAWNDPALRERKAVT